MKRIFFISLLIFTPQLAHAETVPTNEPVVGDWVNSQFEFFLKGCNPKLPAAFKKKSVPYAPSAVLDRLADRKNVTGTEMSGKMMLRLFDTVYSYDAGSEQYPSLPDPLDVATTIGVDRVIDPALNNITYTHDCLTTISAGMSTQSSFDLGFLKSKQALTADMMSDRKAGLSLVYGTFLSPLDPEKFDNQSTTLYYSKIFAWYENNESRIGQRNFLWKRIHGIAVYDLSDMMWSKEYTVSADGSAGAGIGLFRIDVTGDGKATLKDTQKLTASLFRALSFPTGQNAAQDDRFEPSELPAIQAATAKLASVRGRVLSGDGQIAPIISNDPIAVSFVVDGLALCSADWKIGTIASSAGKVDLLGNPTRIPSSDAYLQGCRFDVDYSPPSLDDKKTRVDVIIPIERSFTTSGATPKTYDLPIAVSLGKVADQRAFPRYLLRTVSAPTRSDANVIVKASWLLDAGPSQVDSYEPKIFMFKCGGDAEKVVGQVDDAAKGKLPASKLVELTFTIGTPSSTIERACSISGEIKSDDRSGLSRTRAPDDVHFILPPETSGVADDATGQ